MADCSNTPTPESTANFDLDSRCFSEVITSNADYTISKASDGKSKKTLAAALRDAGWEHVGEWSTNPEVTEPNQVIPYAGTNQLFRPLSLPYQVDSATNPNPNNLLPDPSTGYAGELVDVSKFADEEDVYESAGYPWVGGEISVKDRIYNYQPSDGPAIKVYDPVGGNVIPNSPNGDDTWRVVSAASADALLRFDTLLDALGDHSLGDGYSVCIKGRRSGSVGGGVWDVALTTSVTPNGRTVVQSTANPSLSLILREDAYVSPEQQGSNSDGTTSDSSVLNAMTSERLVMANSEYGLGDQVSLLNDFYGGTFNYNAGLAQAFNFAADNARLERATITSDKHGLQHTNLTRGNGLLNSKITATGYGVLINDTSDGSSKCRIAFNDIYSDTADAVQINNPSRNSKGYMVLGNWLHADANGTSSNSGFAVGIAGIDGHITAFNRSSEAREEAYHLEDTQFMGLQIGNIWDGCLTDGSFIGGQFEGEPESDGLVSIGNRYRHAGFLGSSVGLYYAFPTSNGYLDMCSGIGNYMDKFGTGISLTSKALSYHSGNVVTNSNTAVKQLLSSVCIGDNIAKNVNTLFDGGGASLIGGVHSKDKPTNVVVNSGAANQIGSAIKRFSWKAPYTHGGASATEEFDLFASGDMINGQINLMLQNGTSNFVFSAHITWDGTTLTQTNKVNRSYGNIFGTINIVENGGRVVVRVGSAVAVTKGQLIVDFDGFYFVQ